MKRLKYIAAVIIPLLAFSSCEKLLDVEPRTSISDQLTIVDKGSVETAIRAVYDGSRSYYGTSFQSIGYLSGGDIQSLHLPRIEHERGCEFQEL